MPAKSRQQQKLIYAKRNQYGSKENTPENDKWIWEKEWEQIEENKLKFYKSIFKNKGVRNV